MWLEDVCEAVGAVLAMLILIILAWLSLLATPDQRSAEADAVAEEIEGQQQETRK
jgi:hypothetical protein